MRHPKHGLCFEQGFENFHNAALRFAVKALKGLVEHDNAAWRHDGSQQSDPSFHAARKRMHRTSSQSGQAHLVQQTFHIETQHLPRLRIKPSVRQAYVRGNAEVFTEPVLLEHGNASSIVRLLDKPLIGLLKPKHQPEKGGFPRTPTALEYSEPHRLEDPPKILA